MWRARYAASALFAASLPRKVRAGAVKPIFESMVQLSDHGDLMRRFLALPVPTMFMYGEQNNALSYLATLAGNGVELGEISHSAHFPMYSNAPEMWLRITNFVLEEHRYHKSGERADCASKIIVVLCCRRRASVKTSLRGRCASAFFRGEASR
jgi:hypothetical protein